MKEVREGLGEARGSVGYDREGEMMRWMGGGEGMGEG